MELDYATYTQYDMHVFLEGMNLVIKYGEYDTEAFDIVELYDDCRD